MMDPTLFALLSPAGFSRTAWLTIAPFRYTMTNHPASLAWLTLVSDELANDFAEFVQTNLVSEDVMLDNLPPEFARPTLATPLVSSGIAVRVEGPLDERGLLAELHAAAPSEPILQNTLVHVVVNDAGQVLSAALMLSCGVPQADAEALRLSATARFRPIKSSRAGRSAKQNAYSWGNLVYQWAQVRWNEPVPATK
jgi:hypothetical protein